MAFGVLVMVISVIQAIAKILKSKQSFPRPCCTPRQTAIDRLLIIDMYLQMEEECNNVISLALDGSERSGQEV